MEAIVGEPLELLRLFQTSGVSAHSFLPDDKGDRLAILRAKVRRADPRPDSLGQQRIVELWNGPALAAATVAAPWNIFFSS